MPFYAVLPAPKHTPHGTLSAPPSSPNFGGGGPRLPVGASAGGGGGGGGGDAKLQFGFRATTKNVATSAPSITGARAAPASRIPFRPGGGAALPPGSGATSSECRWR